MVRWHLVVMAGSDSMNYQRFTAIAKRARATRTKEDALVLLADYAESKCATYPADSELFREHWPNDDPPGFVLYQYTTTQGHCHTVRRAEPDPDLRRIGLLEGDLREVAVNLWCHTVDNPETHGSDRIDSLLHNRQPAKAIDALSPTTRRRYRLRDLAERISDLAEELERINNEEE